MYATSPQAIPESCPDADLERDAARHLHAFAAASEQQLARGTEHGLTEDVRVPARAAPARSEEGRTDERRCESDAKIVICDPARASLAPAQAVRIRRGHLTPYSFRVPEGLTRLT